MWREIADAAWICGDPGLQFDSTIQDWNVVPNTGRINATNPCSEFVFLDDTACNLLSLNLMKFQVEGGVFDVERFRRAVDVCFTGQEILVSNASYPTPAIGKNSEALRPLGLGYANLGALLMSMGLMMDCDTTGIEPDLALVKYKKLVGGGLLKIVNGTVPQALRKLGYDSQAVKEIVEYIDENDTIEGAPHLADDHLKVFDCAFKPVKGSRSIAPMGHVRMMAAVQPFISGSMSKTVNLPTEATVEEIEQTYMESWKLGLKCIAIYRDGCKRSQPLSTSLDEKKETPTVEYRAMRHKLPDERRSITHKFDIQGHEGYLTVGLYEDE